MLGQIKVVKIFLSYENLIFSCQELLFYLYLSSASGSMLYHVCVMNILCDDDTLFSPIKQTRKRKEAMQ